MWSVGARLPAGIGAVDHTGQLTGCGNPTRYAFIAARCAWNWGLFWISGCPPSSGSLRFPIRFASRFAALPDFAALAQPAASGSPTLPFGGICATDFSHGGVKFGFVSFVFGGLELRQRWRATGTNSSQSMLAQSGPSLSRVTRWGPGGIAHSSTRSYSLAPGSFLPSRSGRSA